MLINSSSIAVIDSGIGGISVLKSLHKTFKNENFIYFADNEFMPYGNKSESSIKKRLEKIVENLINVYHVKMIVLACNTATTVALKHLQNKFKIAIYGVNPTINTPNKSLIVCTKLTAKQLNKKHYLNSTLFEEDNQNKFLVLPKLASFIENNYFNQKKLSKKVKDIIEKYKLTEYKNIVLACTHYELLYDYFNKNLPNSKIIMPSKNTIKQMIEDGLQKTDSKSKGMVYFLSSLPSKSYIDKLYYIFLHSC